MVDGINEKLRRRHPHVFGSEKAAGGIDALRNWERIKTETEGKKKTKRHPGTPVLHRALRLQEKAVSFGFDWEETPQLFIKLEEEISELKEAVSGGDRKKITEELGDLLFMAVNIARYLDIHPEEALEGSLSKFSRRFRKMEELAGKDDKILEDMDLEEMESYWQETKNRESGSWSQDPEGE